MKQAFDTRKLYFGFPVFFLGYKDDQHGYNITTSSSAYSLGKMMVIGMRTKSNAMTHIKKYGAFSINIPDQSLLKEVEIAGFNSKKDKFALTGLSYQMGLETDTPLVDACPIAIECQVEELVEFGALTNVVARVVSRSVDERLILQEGTLDNQAVEIISYIGDGAERLYRSYNDETVKMGSIIKSLREKEEK